MEGSFVAVGVAVIKVVIAGRLSVAIRRKLRQPLALLARRKANADSQDGGDVAIVILWACLYYGASQHDQSLPGQNPPIDPPDIEPRKADVANYFRLESPTVH